MGKSKSSAKPVPTTSASQRALEKEISEFLQANVGRGAAGYNIPYPEMPELMGQAFDAYAQQFGQISPELQAAQEKLLSGTPAFIYDPKRTSEQWAQTYASPLIETWKETALPMLQESFNLPGVFSSDVRGRGISRAFNEFYGGQVAPSLFQAQQLGQTLGAQSMEAAAGRVPQAVGTQLNYPYQQFMQGAGAAGLMQQAQLQPWLAGQQEFIRTRAEPGWAAEAGMGYMTQPTMGIVGQQGYSPWGDIAQTALAAAMLMPSGGTSAGGTGWNPFTNIGLSGLTGGYGRNF